jgi:putative transposase
MLTKTLKLRIKDKHAAWLRGLAREVNTVFKFCNEVSMKASNPYSGKPKWLSGYDLQKLVSGRKLHQHSLIQETVSAGC